MIRKKDIKVGNEYAYFAGSGKLVIDSWHMPNLERNMLHVRVTRTGFEYPRLLSSHSQATVMEKNGIEFELVGKIEASSNPKTRKGRRAVAHARVRGMHSLKPGDKFIEGTGKNLVMPWDEWMERFLAMTGEVAEREREEEAADKAIEALSERANQFVRTLVNEDDEFDMEDDEDLVDVNFANAVVQHRVIFERLLTLAEEGQLCLSRGGAVPTQKLGIDQIGRGVPG